MKALYKYPQADFPYQRLVEENRRRSRSEPEFEIWRHRRVRRERYWDVQAEYAKGGPDDILIRITVIQSRARTRRSSHLLPTLWFRNTWIWGCTHEGCSVSRRLCRPRARMR